MNLKTIVLTLYAVAVLTTGTAAVAQEDDDDGAAELSSVYPIAVFPFQERGKEVQDLGGKVTDLLFANLVENHAFFLVEREDVKKLLDEGEVNLSGLVNPEQASQVGQLTGAKILVTGSVLQVGDRQYVVGKIISAETGRVLGASAKGSVKGELDELVNELAGKVAETIAKRENDLVAKPVGKVDLIAALQKQIGDGKRPSVYVDIDEQHVGQPSSDPAAATELEYYCKALGFDVIDPLKGDTTKADIKISGTGFSEFATRHGNIISVKSRLEIKAIAQKTGRVLAVDRQTTIGFGLAELVAGKSSLQDAAVKIAARLLPKIANYDKKKNNKKNKE